MKNRFSFAVTLILLISSFLTASLNAQVILDFETGLVSTGYNDVRIPGNQGTLISFKDDLTPSSGIFYRIRFNYTFSSAHTLSLLFAPLTVKSEGRINKDVNFAGRYFPQMKI